MLKFAANLSMMFTELDFTARFRAASEAGFRGVEYLFPYDYSAVTLNSLLEENALEQVLFNAPPGAWDAGERGLAALSEREVDFHASIAKALSYARALDCPRVHVMAGNATTESRGTYIERIRYAADEAAAQSTSITIEPINSRDMPGYFLTEVPQAVDLLDEIGRDNVALQFDIYHAQIMHGDITMLLRNHLERISHIQIASVPDRTEPDDGELNYRYLFDVLAEANYDGWIGCEYRPRAGTDAGLGWISQYLSPAEPTDTSTDS